MKKKASNVFLMYMEAASVTNNKTKDDSSNATDKSLNRSTLEFTEKDCYAIRVSFIKHE